MTIPNIDDFPSLGGAMVNYGPVVDPTTDMDAAKDNRSRCDVAGMTHTAPRAIVAFVGKASSPVDDPTANVHDSMWGNALGVKPVVTRTATGHFVATWPATVVNELGETVTLNLRWATVTAAGSVAYIVNAGVTSANTVDIYVFTDAGAASDAVGKTFTVFAY